MRPLPPSFRTLLLCSIISATVSHPPCLSFPLRLTLKPPSGPNKAPWHSISCLPRTSLLYVPHPLFQVSFCAGWIGRWKWHWMNSWAEEGTCVYLFGCQPFLSELFHQGQFGETLWISSSCFTEITLEIKGMMIILFCFFLNGCNYAKSKQQPT